MADQQSDERELERAELERDVRMGRVPEPAYKPNSRTGFGRVLDALEGIVRALTNSRPIR